MKKKILWEKFENSINKDLNISKLLMVGKFIKSEETDDEESDDKYFKSVYDDDDDDDDGQMVMQFPITNELLENMRLSAKYECWLGHANFDITEDIVVDLNFNVPGIEYLQPLSRYRFMVGIGKSFDFRNVRLSIEEKLGVIDGDE